MQSGYIHTLEVGVHIHNLLEASMCCCDVSDLVAIRSRDDACLQVDQSCINSLATDAGSDASAGLYAPAI